MGSQETMYERSMRLSHARYHVVEKLAWLDFWKRVALRIAAAGGKCLRRSDITEEVKLGGCPDGEVALAAYGEWADEKSGEVNEDDEDSSAFG